MEDGPLVMSPRSPKMEKQVTASKLPNTAPGCPLKALFTFRSVEKKCQERLEGCWGRRQRLCISVCVYACAPVLTLGNSPVPSKDVPGLWARTGGLFLLNKGVCVPGRVSLWVSLCV